MHFSFRSYLEAVEKNPAHFDALRDELGISADSYTKGMQVGSFFNLGQNTYNLGAYKVVGFKYARGGDQPADGQDSPTHALVKMNHEAHLGQPDRKKFRPHGDKMMRVPDGEGQKDDQTYIIPIDRLSDMMTQHMTAAGAGGGAGAGMGMPPM